MNVAELTAAPATPGETAKDARRAMARPRSAVRGYAHRRRALRVQVQPLAPSQATGSDALRRLWDAHALKGGMALFWGWFLVANWGRIAQQMAA